VHNDKAETWNNAYSLCARDLLDDTEKSLAETRPGRVTVLAEAALTPAQITAKVSAFDDLAHAA
jgi:hypothetical protein